MLTSKVIKKSSIAPKDVVQFQVSYIPGMPSLPFSPTGPTGRYSTCYIVVVEVIEILVWVLSAVHCFVALTEHLFFVRPHHHCVCPLKQGRRQYLPCILFQHQERLHYPSQVLMLLRPWTGNNAVIFEHSNLK